MSMPHSGTCRCADCRDLDAHAESPAYKAILENAARAREQAAEKLFAELACREAAKP